MYLQGDNIRVTEEEAAELVRLFPGKFSTNGTSSIPLVEQKAQNPLHMRSNSDHKAASRSDTSAMTRLQVAKSITVGNTTYSEGEVIEVLKMEAWSLFSRFPAHFSNEFGDLTPREIEIFTTWDRKYDEWLATDYEEPADDEHSL